MLRGGRLWLGDDPQPAHQPHLIHHVPVVGDPPIHEAQNVDDLEGDGPAGRGNMALFCSVDMVGSSLTVGLSGWDLALSAGRDCA